MESSIVTSRNSMGWWLSKLFKILFLAAGKNSKSAEYYAQFNDINIVLEANDGAKLGAFLFKPDVVDTNTKHFIVCHGKGIDRYDTANLINAKDLAQKNNASLLIIDYRSFGGSTGSFTKDNAITDLEMWHDYITKKFDTKNVFIIGHSFGGGLAVEYYNYLNEKKPEKQVKKLFLFAPLLSLEKAIAQIKIFNWLLNTFPGFTKSLISEVDYELCSDHQQLEGKALIFHGKEDTDINYKISVDFCTTNNINCYLSNTGHNGVITLDENWDILFKNL